MAIMFKPVSLHMVWYMSEGPLAIEVQLKVLSSCKARKAHDKKKNEGQFGQASYLGEHLTNSNGVHVDVQQQLVKPQASTCFFLYRTTNPILSSFILLLQK